MQTQLKIQKANIGNLFDFPETNSKITKKFCNQHKGNIPVYASSKDENSTLGFIQDNLKNVKYYNNCLSWNRNGSVGYVFIRNHRFATNEDHRALVIKKEYKSTLDKLYLKFEIERQLFINGFSFLNKCGVEKIKGVEILVPVNEKKEFDLEKQKELAEKYEQIQKMKEEIRYFFDGFESLKVDFSDKYKIESIPITKIFETEKGSAKYTKKYIHNNFGKYPVYSSQTTDFGRIGSINTYDYPSKEQEKKGIMNEECFTWTTDGIHAGTIFYRNGKFSITTHCGILKVRPEYKDKIDYEYLKFILSKTLPLNTLGEWANKRLGTERMKEIFIEIPINNKGEFDLEKQKEISEKYYKIEEIKKRLKEYSEEIINLKVQIIEV